ncbi:MAG: hypothetical protein GJ680_07520 [Alteromonadaceae bacterium]|nr:hypothetical protein [Alteromonadaceae bacterium]
MTSNEILGNTSESQSFSELACYHYYFTEAVLNEFEDKKPSSCIADEFGDGEDSFVSDLLQYTAVFYELVDEKFNRDGDLPGVAVYELPERVATTFWSLISFPENDCATMPPLEAFRTEVSQLVENW